VSLRQFPERTTATLPPAACVLFLVLVSLHACRQPARHPSPDEAVSNCESAIALIEEAASDASAEPSFLHTELLAGCADLFVEGGCRQAMRAAADLPANERSASVRSACREAYCPLLEDPCFVACARPFLPDPAPGRSLWFQLLHAILVHDLGPDRAARIYGPLLGAQMLVEPVWVDVPGEVTLPASTASSGGPPPDVEIRVTASGDALHVRVDGEPEEPIALPARPDEADLAPVLSALPSPGDDRGVVLVAGRDVPYEALAAILSSLKTAGHDRIAIAVPDE